jgi:hypothetical protein
MVRIHNARLHVALPAPLLRPVQPTSGPSAGPKCAAPRAAPPERRISCAAGSGPGSAARGSRRGKLTRGEPSFLASVGPAGASS